MPDFGSTSLIMGDTGTGGVGGESMLAFNMETALLRNTQKCNELEDDQESCLHVLTWTALRFSEHTGSGGSSNRFLRAFDEEYEDEDGVKGGDLKKGFLLGRDISRVVKFDRRPHLDKLIEELTEVCAVRYEKPPSDDHIQGLERARAGNVDPSIMRLLPAFDYQKRLDDLVTPSWLVDTFRRYLDEDPWPPSDEARGQLISTGSNKKRARERGKLEQRIPCMKSQAFRRVANTLR
jgi:hypothetical protein